MTSDFYIPTTISQEAQDFIKTFNREMRDNNITPKAKWQIVINEVIIAIKGIYKTFNPKSVGIYGDSAGGGLAASAILKMKDDGIEMPGAIVLWSPWADITETKVVQKKFF